MKIGFTVDILIGLFIINVGFFAAGLLWFSHYNRQANRFLACLMAALSCWLIDGFFRLAGIYQQNPNLYFLPIFYSFAFGPLIYIYVNSLTNSAFQFKRNYWWHFLPVAVQASLYLFLSLQSYEFRNWFWNNVHYPYTYSIEFDGTLLSLLIYLLLSLRLLRKYSRYVQENFSETSQLTLRWLRVLLVIIALVCIQWAIELILRHRFNLYFHYDYSYWLLGLLLIVLGTAGLQQTNLANVQFKDEAVPDSLPLLPRSDVQVSPEQIAQVRRAMDTDKLYLNPTLTLTELARHLGLNPKVVSQIINAGIGQSFNNFVNSYRISEVKQRLRTDDLTRFTLLGIAFESGFNSKTTFNRIFKEHTGQSPSEYAGQS